MENILFPFRAETERLVLQPYDGAYLQDYYREFTEEIARYQYPDPFADVEEADALVSSFVAEMAQGSMLELVILTRKGEFLGSAEVFGLTEKTPEVGLWLKKTAQGKGYGTEALTALFTVLNSTGRYTHYLYEVDVRNVPGIRLVEKFPYEKASCEVITTESGKKLTLQTYRVLAEKDEE